MGNLLPFMGVPHGNIIIERAPFLCRRIATNQTHYSYDMWVAINVRKQKIQNSSQNICLTNFAFRLRPNQLACEAVKEEATFILNVHLARMYLVSRIAKRITVKSAARGQGERRGPVVGACPFCLYFLVKDFEVCLPAEALTRLSASLYVSWHYAYAACDSEQRNAYWFVVV